jgi:hypothetical protein
MHETPIPDAIPFRTLAKPAPGLYWAIAVFVVLGLLGILIASGDPDPGRVWRGLLFNWLFWSSVAQGMVMFAVALHIVEADWAWSIRRFALGGVAFLPISLLLLPFIIWPGHHHLFHHWLEPYGSHAAVVLEKTAWLNWPGLGIRNVVVVAALYALSIAFAYYCLRPDVYGVPESRRLPLYDRLTRNWRGIPEDPRHAHRMATRIAPVLALAFALLWAVVAIDLAMSLMPHWFSTMFPVAFFWTAFHGGVAATAVAVTLLRRPMGLESFITPRQYHDLGKLVFAFSVFWMYLQWSQYIVIWYGLFPWEQEWFVQRFDAPFGLMTNIVLVLVFVLPFFGLLTRPPKKIPVILATFGGLILVGHWLERYLLVVPSLWEGVGNHFGLAEIAMGLGFLGLFVMAYLWFVRTFPMLPSPVTLATRRSAVVAVPSTATEV